MLTWKMYLKGKQFWHCEFNLMFASHVDLYKQISQTVFQLALTGWQQHYSQSDSGLNLDKLCFSVYEVVPFFTTFDMQ